MKITKKEKLFYSDKLETLGVDYHDVYEMTKQVFGLKSEICRNLNIASSSLCCVLTGQTNNPKTLYNVYQYLKERHNNPFFTQLQNIPKSDKRLDNLLMNGFSYWEAVRIAQ